MKPEPGYQLLWIAVVQQALDDVACAPRRSSEYDDAVAFFSRTEGSWAVARAEVADHLKCHPDAIIRAGRAAIAARRSADGLPPDQPQPAPKPKPKPPQVAPKPGLKPKPPPLPRLVATFNPPPEPQPKPKGGWARYGGRNPFNPWQELPSETRRRTG